MLDINIRHELIIALGMNKGLFKSINEIYRENKWKYYEASIPFRNDLTVKMHSAIEEEMMLKVAGIINYSYEIEDMSLIMKLIRKGYKPVYRYIKDCDKSVNTMDFLNVFNDMYSYEKTEQDEFNEFFVGVYLAKYWDKELIYSEEVMNILDKYFSVRYKTALYNDSKHVRQLIKDYKTENKQEFKDGKREFVFDYGISSIEDNLNNFFDQYINEAYDEKIKPIYEKRENVPYYKSLEIRNTLFGEGMVKYIGFFSGYVKTLGLYPDYIAENTDFSRRKLDRILTSILPMMPGNNISKNEREAIYVACLFIYNFADAYKKLKDDYLRDAQEELFIENKKTLEKLNEKESALRSKAEELENEKKKIAKEREEYNEKIASLEKTVEKLENKVDTHEDNKKELVALRDYAYKSAEAEDYTLNTVEYEDKVGYLNKLDAVVFGGHPNFLAKLKQELPNYTYRDADSLNKSTSIIEKMDVVFLQTCFFNHSYYYKVMEDIKSVDNVKLVYLSGYDNMELTIDEMYDKLTKE